MDQDEQTLDHDGMTHVVRIGQTVRRPVRPFTSTMHEYLRHVRSRGVDFVPEPLGYDEQGREVLSFIGGDVPVEPLPAWATRDGVLVALARLIRRLHDAAEDWEPPSAAVWGSVPGVPSVPVPPLFDVPELVAHQDYCPGNVVFRDGSPFALIDFDLARPTTRVADCVNALHWWAPLMHPQDRAPALRDADVPRRVRLFADGYGLSPDQRAAVVGVAVQRARNLQVTMRAAADVDPVFSRWWDDRLKDRLPRAEQWLAEESERLERELLNGAP